MNGSARSSVSCLTTPSPTLPRAPRYRDRLFLRQPPRRADRLRQGQGIPQRVQGRIFERFYTGDSAGGSGPRAGDRQRARPADGRTYRDQLQPRFTAFTLELPRPPDAAPLTRPLAKALPQRSSTRERLCAGGGAPRPARRLRRGSSTVIVKDKADRASSDLEAQTADEVPKAKVVRRLEVIVEAASTAASTRPRSTAKPRPAWSRSARSSAAPRAPPRAPASSSTRTVKSSPTPTSSPTNRGGVRKPPGPKSSSNSRTATLSRSPNRRLRPVRRRRPDEGRTGRASRFIRSNSATTTTLEVGEPVAAIGSPFGEQQLALGRSRLGDRPLGQIADPVQIEGAIQTDASINPGNSGGPLLEANAQGDRDQPADRDRLRRQRRRRLRGADLGDRSARSNNSRKGQRRIRLPRRLQPGALPAARRTSWACDTEFGALIADVVPGGPAARRPG